MSRLTAEARADYASPITGLFSSLRGEPDPDFLDTVRPVVDADAIPGVMEAAQATHMTAQDRKGIGGDLTGDVLPINNLSAVLKYCEEDTVPPFYEVLNQRCYEKNRSLIKPFVNYIWLLMKSLGMLPPYHGSVVNRGVRKDLSKDYPVGKKFVWHGFTSTAKDVGVLTTFLGKHERTMFQIELTQQQARDISKYSPFEEGEVLLPPGSRFEVKGLLQPAPQLTIIQLVELRSPSWIIDLRPKVTIGLAEVAEKFTQFDMDGNGKISKEEMLVVFTKLGLEPDAADRVITMADKDESGDLDIAEFVAWLSGGSEIAEVVIKGKQAAEEEMEEVAPEAHAAHSVRPEIGSTRPRRLEATEADRERTQRISPISPTSAASDLSTSDFFTVKTDMKTNSKPPIELAAGVLGHIFKIDEDGDAMVEFDDFEGREWILKKHFDKLQKVGRPPVPQTLHVSGATGTNQSAINGVYCLADDQYNNHPIWNKINDSDSFLLRFPTGTWNVTTGARKESGDAGGFLVSCANHYAMVTSVPEWKVWDGDSWEFQSLDVVEATEFHSGDFIRVKQQMQSNSKPPVDIEQDLIGHIWQIDGDGDAQVEFDSLACKEWILKKNFYNMEKVPRPRVPQTVHISGATGTNSSCVNGVWRLEDELYYNHPMWTKANDSDKLLLRMSGGTWYVANSSRKESGEAGGWLQSDKSHYADPTNVPQWKLYTGESWELQDISVVEAPEFRSGNYFRVKHQMTTNSKPPVELTEGLPGHILRIDEDGDAEVEFDILASKEWILKKNFFNMEKMAGPPVPRTLHISGANGTNSSFVNGIWCLADEEYNSSPMWVKTTDSDKFLLRMAGGTWYVASGTRKESGEAGGWLQSSANHYAAATNVPEWKLYNGDSWEVQTLEIVKAPEFHSGDFFRVKHVMNTNSKPPVELAKGLIGHIFEIDGDGDAQVEFDSVGAKEWILKKNFYNLAKTARPPVPMNVTISGATGSNADCINGVYNLMDERFSRHHTWRKASDFDKWLVRFPSGNWLVTVASRKESGEEGGFLQSCQQHYAFATSVPQWKVWIGDAWEEQAVSVVA